MANSSSDPVCISHFGAVTPLGSDLDEVSSCLFEGRSGIKPIGKFDTSSFATKWAGIPDAGNDAIRWPRADDAQVPQPGELLYAQAAVERLANAFDPLSVYDGDRLGCVIGVDEPAIDVQRCIGLLERLEPGQVADRDAFFAEAIRHFRLSELLDLDVTSVLRTIHRKIPFSGYARCHVGLCSASLQAMGMARAAIASGRIDAAIVGGVSAKVTPVNVARLEAIGALCTDANLPGAARSRPFDARRSGFVPAEGAVLFLLESETAIRRRGHTPLARLLGYGSSLAAEHIVAPHTQDLEMRLCMSRALDDAGLPPRAISCINAHGTSTKLNDLHEARAIRHLFGGEPPPVTAAKSLHGHLIAAAGAMEVLGLVASFRHDFLAAIANLDEVDPAIALPLVHRTTRGRVDTVLKNSFGMGGLAASMVLQNPRSAA